MLIEGKITHPKWIEWCSKTEDESEEIAEENMWSWWENWYEIGYDMRKAYEQANPNPKIKDTYRRYDGYYKKHEQGKSYVYLGWDACFHETEEPVRTWTEYHPCTNKKCPYYDPKGWGNGGGNCGYFGDNSRLTECFDDLFATITAYIDICGIENIDKMQRETNIHPDIIGWFKYGDAYFGKKRDTMKMKDEAIDEITEVLEKVQDVQKLVGKMGITFDADSWTAITSDNLDWMKGNSYKYENILIWEREDFEEIDVSKINSFSIGGNVITKSHEYNGEYINEPKALMEAKVNTVKKLLQDIVDTSETEYFKLHLEIPYELYDNDGWEQFVCIDARPIMNKCIGESEFEIFIDSVVKVKAFNYDDALEKVNLMKIVDMDKSDISMGKIKKGD